MTRPHRRRPRPAWLLAPLASLLAGCATIGGGGSGQPLVPSRYETRTGPFAVYTLHPIAPDAPAVRTLQSLERDVAATLGLRAPADGTPVEVYVLKDREAFAHFLRFYYPELPPRRAFFLAQGPKRVVYTFTNDRLDEDLRHEATHALINAAVGDLPIWLDEGLAEYFEGADGRRGVNPEHLGRLPDDLKAGWLPDLARLETLKTVREMTPRDYRESWAWVHSLLNGPPAGKAALLSYLADVHARQTTPEPPTIARRLGDGQPEADRQNAQRLLAHLERLRADPPLNSSPSPTATAALPAPADPAVVQAQTHTVDAPRTAARRSLLGRFLNLFTGPGRPS